MHWDGMRSACTTCTTSHSCTLFYMLRLQLQELGLADWSAERHTCERTPAGQAWHTAFAAFAGMLHRHMDTLLQVGRGQALQCSAMYKNQRGL